MIHGLRGSLLSHDALTVGGFTAVRRTDLENRRSLLTHWHGVLERQGGPTWTARTVLDRVALPFCRSFELEVVILDGDEKCCRGVVRRQGSPVAALVTFGWGREPAAGWRDSIRAAIGSGVRWCYCFTGPTLRVFDAARTHSRRFAELDLDAIARHPDSLSLAWTLLGSADRSHGLDAAVQASERHRVDVRSALQRGVHDALTELIRAFARALSGTRRSPHPDLMDQALVVVYRVLFLLFAEARGLVPTWHPVYRESYTVDALRDALETGRRVPGLWEALQAISRLAHSGCQAGTLRVPPFNGRLFSPEQARLADTISLDDSAVRAALLALTTRRTAAGRQRIAFSDLGVEHLGGVYERVLDFELQMPARGQAALVSSSRRKTTGSFYTPRSLTEYLVRRTLAPLIEEATPERILGLRVLDPAMGSGAFLVAACRYLASAYEAALVREGGVSASDVTDADRASFRRVIAQRTLFGVDANPMAVQLARLSLWLTTLCGDRPLTFFDHHLRTGNSLVGANLTDILRVRSGRRQPLAPTPLLTDAAMHADLSDTVVARLLLTTGREDTLEEVRSKEALFARLSAEDSPIGGWKALCDLWCAGWFDLSGDAVNRATFGALMDAVRGRSGGVDSQTWRKVVDRGRVAARRERFFHWELEFPEIFRDRDGAPLDHPGFDAVIGNPPWEVLRGDAGDAGARLTRFSRGSGVYQLQGMGHANLYQLFLERSLSLIRRGGRLGLVLPSGIASDHGSSRLRRFLLDRTTIDSFTSVENREALFPIHRGLKFVLLTLSRNAAGTPAIPHRSGIVSASAFDDLPEGSADPLAVAIPRQLVERFSGDQLAIPDLRTCLDLEILSRIMARAPAAGDESGWALAFGRELNATDDRHHFTTTGGELPVIEGKHVQPFAVDVASCGQFIAAAEARRIVKGNSFERPRLAYRDVASATNRLTLIAAVLPAGTITTHTLFCLKTTLDEEAQHFLAGLFNSLVANYLVRLRITTHVSAAVIERLPLPRPDRDSRGFVAVAALARRLAHAPSDGAAMVELQVEAARLYGLDRVQFEHVLSTFPLVDEGLRRASLMEYSRTL
jgi:hypothetical protein